ncbi:TY5A [Symbiodinium sp. CCMP2592]|nr:TY5A [Symbiodinium sp. CCMP2592]
MATSAASEATPRRTKESKLVQIYGDEDSAMVTDQEDLQPKARNNPWPVARERGWEAASATAEQRGEAAGKASWGQEQGGAASSARRGVKADYPSVSQVWSWDVALNIAASTWSRMVTFDWKTFLHVAAEGQTGGGSSHLLGVLGWQSRQVETLFGNAAVRSCLSGSGKEAWDLVQARELIVVVNNVPMKRQLQGRGVVLAGTWAKVVLGMKGSGRMASRGAGEQHKRPEENLRKVVAHLHVTLGLRRRWPMESPSTVQRALDGDSFYVWDKAGRKFVVTHFIGSLDDYHIGDLTDREILQDLWIASFGDLLVTDGWPEFCGNIETVAALFGMVHEVVFEGAKWRMGLAERHGAIIKLMMSMNLEGMWPPRRKDSSFEQERCVAHAGGPAPPCPARCSSISAQARCSTWYNQEMETNETLERADRIRLFLWRRSVWPHCETVSAQFVNDALKEVEAELQGSQVRVEEVACLSEEVVPVPSFSSFSSSSSTSDTAGGEQAQPKVDPQSEEQERRAKALDDVPLRAFADRRKSEASRRARGVMVVEEDVDIGSWLATGEYETLSQDTLGHWRRQRRRHGGEDGQGQAEYRWRNLGNDWPALKKAAPWCGPGEMRRCPDFGISGYFNFRVLQCRVRNRRPLQCSGVHTVNFRGSFSVEFGIDGFGGVSTSRTSGGLQLGDTASEEMPASTAEGVIAYVHEKVLGEDGGSELTAEEKRLIGRALKWVNATVRRAREDLNLVIRKFDCDPAELLVVSVSDAAYGAMPNGGHQGGTMIFAHPAVLRGAGAVCIMEAASTKIQRVVRCSMSAEVSSLATAFEHGDFVRAVLAELLDPNFRIERWTSKSKKILNTATSKENQWEVKTRWPHL